MSWTNKLLETYEMCASQIGIRKEGTILLPTGHIEQRAQIEVVLDEQGNFKEANELSIDEATTIIPVTEDSASNDVEEFLYAGNYRVDIFEGGNLIGSQTFMLD